MNSRWSAMVTASLVVFTGLVIAWQFVHHDDVAALREWIAQGRKGARPTTEISSSLYQSFVRGKQLAAIHDIVKRDQIIVQAAGFCRYVDLLLPTNARVFVKDMTGPANMNRLMNFYYLTYYLFPREVGVSIDQPTRLEKDWLAGRTATSDQEILANGYDAVVESPTSDTLMLKLLRPKSELPVQEPVTPAWFFSVFDKVAAFLLPLLTALAGVWLVRFLVPDLSRRMPLLEQLGCGLGLGLMAVAAITLGVKLCGFQGRGLILLVTAAGAAAEIWRGRKSGRAGITGIGKEFRHPVSIGFGAIVLLVFVILFRLAGLQGLIDYDAVSAVSLKAKIIHLYTGNDIVRWFSTPRLALAHTDYPTLLPSMHSATYDSIGHINEFVTKFWPTWMLLVMVAALFSLVRDANGRWRAPLFGLAGLLLLPATQRFVQTEGGTLPMVFFTVLGFVQCAWWLVEKDSGRLGLGLTLLFGAAMTKFEGFIFLALVAGWMLLLPSARPTLKPSPLFWRVTAFWLLAALPFVCLRLQIPVLDYESNWLGYALRDPVTLLSNWPGMFMILVSQLFISIDFACWNGEGGRLNWTGNWDGFSSLYNHSTLGLAWLCLLMTIALWFARPARRQAALWVVAMVVLALAAFSAVFTSFVSITDLDQVMRYTGDQAGRYFLPMLMAWFATTFTLFFAEHPAAASVPTPEATASAPPATVKAAGNQGTARESN
jgi:hypothetical protein